MKFSLLEKGAQVIKVDPPPFGLIKLTVKSTQPIVGILTTQENADSLFKNSKLDDEKPIQVLFEIQSRFEKDIFISKSMNVLIFLNLNKETADVNLELEGKQPPVYGGETGPPSKYPGSMGTSSVSGLGF